MKRFIDFSLTALVMTLGTVTSPARADIALGVNAPRGHVVAAQQWQPLGQHWSTLLGETVTIVPLSPAQFADALGQNQIQAAIINPVGAVQAALKGAVPLATQKRQGLDRFGGVIVAKATSGIAQLEDLKGKKVGAYQFGVSAGAYVFQVYELHQRGIDPTRDFALFREVKKQDDSVLAVKAGLLDVGFVRTGFLEAMAAEGRVQLTEFTIVNAQTPAGFPQALSTALYPEWVLIAQPTLNDEQRQKLAAAALSLAPDHPAAKQAGIDGFTPAPDLQPLQTALVALGLVVLPEAALAEPQP